MHSRRRKFGPSISPRRVAAFMGSPLTPRLTTQNACRVKPSASSIRYARKKQPQPAASNLNLSNRSYRTYRTYSQIPDAGEFDLDATERIRSANLTLRAAEKAFRTRRFGS